EPGRVSRGPLHELDLAAIGILHGDGQKLDRAVGGTWLSDVHVMLTQRIHGLVHRVDLAGEAAPAGSQIDILSSGFGRNKLDRHELVVGQPEHRETTEFGLRHGPDDLEAERLVEGQGGIEIGDSQSWAQCSHGRSRLPRFALGYSTGPAAQLDSRHEAAGGYRQTT